MDPTPFGAEGPTLDSWSVGESWTNKKGPPFERNVPRDQVVAFTVYTHDHGVLNYRVIIFVTVVLPAGLSAATALMHSQLKQPIRHKRTTLMSASLTE